MIETTATIRRVIPEPERTLVAFAEHDAYFVALGAMRGFFDGGDALRHALSDALTGRRVRFSYDLNLIITDPQWVD